MIRLPIFLVAKFCPNAISDNPNFKRAKNFHFNVKQGFLKYFFIFLFNKIASKNFLFCGGILFWKIKSGLQRLWSKIVELFCNVMHSTAIG